MFRVLIVLAVTVPASFSQISGLATTDTGGQLYFSTSLRLRGTHGNFDPKILRYVGVFQPFREAEPKLRSRFGLKRTTFSLPIRRSVETAPSWRTLRTLFVPGKPIVVSDSLCSKEISWA